MAHADRPNAIVLAGGRSRRMEQDKALLRLPDGRTACDAVLAVARRVAGRVYLAVDSEEHGARLRRSLSWEPLTIVDRAPGQGPLAALAGALQAAKAPAALLLAVDAPLIAPGLLELLHERWLAAGRPANCVAVPVCR
jgi:molybdopterin-guanine dinucleotide biosynthesis protein A